MDSPKAVPSLALAAYSEDLVTGRRVVIFGDALSGLAETLVERGARLVHVYDENPTRVAEAAARSTSSSISFAPLSPGGIAARDGAFDVGFVEELASFSDPGQLITKLHRALSARGVGLVATTNTDVSPYWGTNAGGEGRSALTYYELYDLISTHFDEVRMVGQTPFVGYALADFSPDSEGEFSIDTGFVPGGAEEPERYIAVCSHFPVAVEPFCVVQMQASEVLSDGAYEEPSSDASASSTASNAELTELRRELASEREAKVKLEQLLRDVNDELVRRDEWVQELESRAATADERADAAEAELERLQTTPSVTESPAQLDSNAAELTELTAQLNERTREVEVQRRTIEKLRLELAQSEQAATQRVQRLTDLEKQLTELQRRLTDAEVAKANALAAQATAHARASDLSERLGEAERLQSELAELQATVAELRTQMGGLRSDLHLANDEIARGEQQLAEQGQTVLSLRADLVETERFAALLLVERDALQNETATQEAATQPEKNLAGPAAIVDGAPPSSESLLDEQFPPETLDGEPPSQREISSNSHSIPPPPDGQQALEQARIRQAELEASLQATRWTVEELENRLAERSNEPELLERLYRAERQLQRQATLIEQFERNVRIAPSVEEPTL